jgi:serine/threonine protein kinase
MPAILECPTLEQWHNLFRGTLAAEERAQCERHLEVCPVCQRRLDHVEDFDDLLRGRARRAGDPTLNPLDPTLVQVLNRLQSNSSTGSVATEPVDLYFLEATDRPDLLGMLGQYEVQELIGAGGMGVVLKAFDPGLHRLVAIKVLAPALAGSATARRRFTREAQAAAAVCHDHIVPVHAVREQAGLPYLVMQYVAGESLQARLDRSGPLKVEDIVRIGLQTAAGLAAAHAQGLIHRDIKPANLLLENGLARVKISDFGLARTADDVKLTQAGVVAGTPEYMAPEQARGEVVDHRADLFSLGSVLYAMCTCQPPFRATATLATLRQVSEQQPVPPRSLNPDVPAFLDAVILRLLEKDPAARFASAAETATLLEGYLAHLQQPASTKAPQLPARPGAATDGRSVLRLMRGVGRHVPRLAWPVLVLLLVALLLPVRQWFGAGDDPGKPAQPATPAEQKRKRLTLDLRAGVQNLQGLILDGPDVDTVTSSDAQGLRVTLPEGRRDIRPIILHVRPRLRGDVDITVSYEVLAVGDPAPQHGAGVVLRVWFDDPQSPCAILSRTRKLGPPTRDLFGAHKTLRGPDGNPQYVNNAELQSQRLAGKLRLIRRGDELQYLVAEGDDPFKALQTVKIGDGEVTQLQVDCTTSWTRTALDARLTELVIEADAFPDGPPAEQPVASSDVSAPHGTGSWLIAAGVVALMLLVFAGSGGLVLIVRSRRGGQVSTHAQVREAPSKAEALLVFACTGCGQKLQVKARLGGKTVKCPKCGQSVTVPVSKPDKAELPRG